MEGNGGKVKFPCTEEDGRPAEPYFMEQYEVGKDSGF